MRTVIVGSGLAGITVAEGLKQASPGAALSLVTSEKLGFYPRPLLSHGFSREEQRDRLVQKTFGALRDSGIEVFAGSEALAIDRPSRTLKIRLEDGREQYLVYDRLVLAQGSAAFIPPSLRASRRAFRTLNSLEDLDSLSATRRRVRAAGGIPEIALLGGGLIGCEVASDLAKAGDRVTLVHGADRLLERLLDPENSRRLRDHLGIMGVTVILGARADGVSEDPATGRSQLRQADLAVTPWQDAVVVATGFAPRTDLATASGLAVNRGIVVDGRFRTSDPSIYAVGDVAEIVLAEGEGKLYPFVAPIRNQALHLVALFSGASDAEWAPPAYKPTLKVHGFKPI